MSAAAMASAPATGSAAASALRAPQARLTAVGRVAISVSAATAVSSPRTWARATPIAPAAPSAGAPRTARVRMQLAELGHRGGLDHLEPPG